MGSMKLFAIIFFFTPLMAYGAHLVAQHGHQFHIWHLGIFEQSLILFLLVMPTLIWRQLDVFSPRRAAARPDEPHPME